jgi:hypothetical protein
MALTCNYFSSNDYTRKHTMRDIKEMVIKERSTATKGDINELALNQTFLVGESSVLSSRN